MKTHWKKLIDHNFINEGDLDNGNIVATIKSVALEEVTGPGGKKEDLHVLRFVEPNVKPMILSAKINFKNIQTALKTPYIEEWAGKKIEIYYDPNIKFGKETVGGVRIKATAPKITLPEMNASNEHWGKMIESLKAGNTTLDKVRKSFFISKETEDKINELLKS